MGCHVLSPRGRGVGRGRGAVPSHDASECFEWVSLGACVLACVPALERVLPTVGAGRGRVVLVTPALVADCVVTVASGLSAMCVVFVVHCFPLCVAPFELHPTGSPGALVVVGSEFSPYLGGVLVWSRPVLFPPSFRSSDGPALTSPVGAYLGTCPLWGRHGAVLAREARHLNGVHPEPAHVAAAHLDHLPVASM